MKYTSKSLLSLVVSMSVWLAVDVATAKAQTWDAALDLVANEKPDQPDPSSTELLNPNGQRPEWVYGYRATLGSTSLTPFAASANQHSNAALREKVDELEGWQLVGGFWPFIVANVTGQPLTLPGLQTLQPDELSLHPGNGFSSDTFAVVRWIAPAAGNYDISAAWRDLDPNGGDGFGAHIVLNGASIFDANPANGGSTSDARAISLSAGDFLDFVVEPGPSGDQNFDSTALKVVITGGSPGITFHRLGTLEDVKNPKGSVDEPLIPVTDPSILKSLPTVAKGVVADGVTPLIIKVDLGHPWDGDPVRLSFVDWAGGSLASPHPALMVLDSGSWVPGFEVPLNSNTGVGYALIGAIPTEAVTTSPGSPEVTANLTATVGPDEILTQVSFRKPPIVFVHGVESDASTWKESFLNEFTINGRVMRAVSYSNPTSGEFGELANALDTILINQIEGSSEPDLSKQNWAMTRYDVVGHSQGGILLRMLCTVNTAPLSTYFTGQLPFKNPGNFNRGRFRRVVTIGSPHNGLMIAYWLVQWRISSAIDDLFALYPGARPLLDYGLLKFNPFGSDIAVINHGAFKVDDDARFLLVSAQVQQGESPSPFIMMNIPSYNAIGLWTAGEVVLPFGSDGVVEPESAEAGRFARPQTDNGVIAWNAANVSHAYFSNFPSLFGTDMDHSETSSPDLAASIDFALDQAPSAFKPWIRPTARPASLQQQIDASIPFTLVGDIIRFLTGSNPSLPGHKTQVRAMAASYKFGFSSDAQDPQVETIQWSVSVFGANGETIEGVTATPDSDDPSKVTVLVDEAVIGDVVLKCSYLSTDGTFMLAAPALIASMPPAATQTGVELRLGSLQLESGTETNIEIWRLYNDGTSTLAYLPPASPPPVVSSAPDVVSIAGSSRAIANAAGTVTLTATLDGFQSQTNLSVTDPKPPPQVQLIAAVSRKVHGSAGTFDINLPLTGTRGVECRTSGGDYTLVFTFQNSLVGGSASVATGAGAISGPPILIDNTMTVNLTGVADAQTLTLALSNVTDNFGQVMADATVSVGILIGDTTGDEKVKASDIRQTKGQVGLPVTSTNFREDVNVSGAIDRSDVQLVRSKKGGFLP